MALQKYHRVSFPFFLFDVVGTSKYLFCAVFSWPAGPLLLIRAKTTTTTTPPHPLAVLLLSLCHFASKVQRPVAATLSALPKSLKLIFVTGSNGKMARGQPRAAFLGSRYGAAAAAAARPPCFPLPVKRLNWCQSPHPPPPGGTAAPPVAET